MLDVTCQAGRSDKQKINNFILKSMKTKKTQKGTLNRVMMISLLLCFVSCSHADEPDNGQTLIDGISFENYPRVDGSTSTKPLNALIACKLLDLRYEWMPDLIAEWSVWPNSEDIPEAYSNFFGERIKASQTHNAFMNLIDGDADIILTHRTISPDEKAHADENGITLVETPIALDAFVFVVHKNNPVRNLTVSQVQKIYTGEIKNWKEVGGNNAPIQPFNRPRNSGSEEIMRSLVMNGLEVGDFPESRIETMAGVFLEVKGSNGNGICYTFKFYKEVMVRVPDEQVPKISINGIFPDDNTVRNQSYPFISKVHVAIRSDLDRNSMAYKMYEWLQTEAVNDIISESGYIPQNTASSVSKTNTENIHIYPNPVSDGFYANAVKLPSRLILFDISGRNILSKQVFDREFINIAHLPKGVYFVQIGDRITKILKE